MSAPTTRSRGSAGDGMATQHSSCDAPHTPFLQSSQFRQFPTHASSQGPPRKVHGNRRAHAQGAAVLMTAPCLCASAGHTPSTLHSRSQPSRCIDWCCVRQAAPCSHGLPLARSLQAHSARRPTPVPRKPSPPEKSPAVHEGCKFTSRACHVHHGASAARQRCWQTLHHCSPHLSRRALDALQP